MTFRKISKNKAKEKISDFIIDEKENGTKKLSTLDIVMELKIPANQVEEVMKDFERKNMVKEIDA